MTRPVVVIDDHPAQLEFEVTLLRRAGFEVKGFVSAARAIRYVAKTNAAVVITALFMPDVDGIEVLRRVRKDFPSAAVVGIGGGRGDFGSSLLQAMIALGAAAVFDKPLDQAGFLAKVADLLKPSARRVFSPHPRRCSRSVAEPARTLRSPSRAHGCADKRVRAPL